MGDTADLSVEFDELEDEVIDPIEEMGHDVEVPDEEVPAWAQ